MESEARLDRLQSFTRCNRIWAAVLGCTALLWFLLRVVPKPSRASYPCQRAAFPLASGFVLWLCAIAGGMFSLARLRRFVRVYRYAVIGVLALADAYAWKKGALEWL